MQLGELTIEQHGDQIAVHHPRLASPVMFPAARLIRWLISVIRKEF